MREPRETPTIRARGAARKAPQRCRTYRRAPSGRKSCIARQRWADVQSHAIPTIRLKSVPNFLDGKAAPLLTCPWHAAEQDIDSCRPRRRARLHPIWKMLGSRCLSAREAEDDGTVTHQRHIAPGGLFQATALRLLTGDPALFRLVP